jgi:hypothetical protein
LNSLFVLHQQDFERVKGEDMKAMMGKDNGTGSAVMEGDRLVYFRGIQGCRRINHC